MARTVDTPDSRASGRVRITLAGGLTIHHRGHDLGWAELRSRRAEIAFTRLAIGAGQTVSRRALAEAIWDEHSPASWESALRTTIATLRRWLRVGGLGASVEIATVGDGYRLTLTPGTEVDLTALPAVVTRIELLVRARGVDADAVLALAEAAIASASTPILAGAEGVWIDGLREQIAQLRLRLARVCGFAALAHGDATTAERMGRDLIADAPSREDGYRLLMSALRAAGNRAEALLVYDSCRRRLLEELGALPSPPTEALFRELLAQDVSDTDDVWTPQPSPASAGPLLMLQRQSPLVGRAALLEQLQQRLAVASAAGPLLIRITGGPGQGKTRLAAELAARARGRAMSVLYGRADDRIAVPYGSLLEALQGGLASLDARDVARQWRPIGTVPPHSIRALTVWDRSIVGVGDLDSHVMLSR
jgi:SARP family transcriptional regulator, regulator of embCAB operon